MERNFATFSARAVAPQPAGDGGVLNPDAVGKQPALQFRGGASLLAQGEQFALVAVEARAAVAGTAAGAGLSPQAGGPRRPRRRLGWAWIPDTSGDGVQRGGVAKQTPRALHLLTAFHGGSEGAAGTAGYGVQLCYLRFLRGRDGVRGALVRGIAATRMCTMMAKITDTILPAA